MKNNQNTLFISPIDSAIEWAPVINEVANVPTIKAFFILISYTTNTIVKYKHSFFLSEAPWCKRVNIWFLLRFCYYNFTIVVVGD